MSRTFIVTEVETRTWRVEIKDEEVERILGLPLPMTADEEHLELCAADFISEPDPERGTITLLSAKIASETEEVER